MHWFWRATIAVIVSFFAVGYLFRPALLVFGMAGLDRSAIVTTRLIGFIAPLAVFGLLTHYLGSKRLRDSETRCRKCGYILRGITEPRCPECGERI